MVKAHAPQAARGASGGSSQRAKIVEEYDRLIAEFGDEHFRPAGESTASDAADSAAPADRHELLKEVTEKSVRCAEVIEKALAAGDKFKRMDEKIAKAHREYEAGAGDGDADDDEDMDGASDDENDEEAALLLKELITASEEMQEANKKLAKAGAVAKPSRTSGELDASSTDGNMSAISDEFRDLYMEEFTSAFGDELDQFRREDRFESKDVAYLISCIQSGADVFTPLQKKLFVESAHSSSGQ